MPVRVSVAGADELPALQQLRGVVFGEERAIPTELDIDGRDGEAIQVAAYADDRRLIGTGRVLIDEQTARVGRMAVDASWRSRGVGERMLRRLEIEARRRGAQLIELHAMSPAYPFYERSGYQSVGDEIEVVGYPHLLMFKQLPVLRAARDTDSADLITLIDGCFSEYPGCVLDVDGEEPWLRRPASAYAEADGALWVFTDDVDGPVIACGAAKRSDDQRDEVKSMYVSAAYRRLGLAADLLAMIEQWVAGRDREIHLWTDSRFTEAHRFYENAGYHWNNESRELHDKSNTVEYHYVR